MEILTVSFREEETIFCKFRKKNNEIIVEDYLKEQGLLNYIENKESEKLASFFKDIVNELDCNSAVINVTIPTHLCRNDCWKSEKASSIHILGLENLVNWVKTLLKQENSQEYCIGIPMVCSYRKNYYVTGSGVSKKYIEVIYAAFKKAQLDIATIENETIAYIRTIGKWNTDYTLIELENSYSNITNFSSSIGLTTTTIPGGENYVSLSVENNQNLMNDIMCSKLIWQNNFQKNKDSKTSLYYVIGQSVDVLKNVIQKNEVSQVLSIVLPTWLVNKIAIKSSELFLPVGIVARYFYEGEDQNVENSYNEFFAGISGNRTEISAIKEKVKKIFSFNFNYNFFKRNK